MIIVLIWNDKICLELIKIFNQKYAICYDFEIAIASGDNIKIEIFDKIIESKPIDSFYEMDCIYINCCDSNKIAYDIKHNKTPNSVLIDTSNAVALYSNYQLFMPLLHEHVILSGDIISLPSIETIVIIEVLNCFLKYNVPIQFINTAIVHNHPLTKKIIYQKSHYNEIELNILFQMHKLINKSINITPQSIYTDGQECIMMSIAFDCNIDIDEIIMLLGMVSDTDISVTHINQSIYVDTEYNFNVIFNGNKIMVTNLFYALLCVMKII